MSGRIIRSTSEELAENAAPSRATIGRRRVTARPGARWEEAWGSLETGLGSLGEWPVTRAAAS